MPDTETLIRYGGLLLVFLAVFGQTGLFFCFFIPSGGLLFTAGIFLASGDLPYSIFSVCILLVLAAVMGNITGYYFGLKAGPFLYKKNRQGLLNKAYLEKAESFYTKYGNLALAGGLFFPIIRTFSPIIAGMIKLKFSRFVFYTSIGSVLWIISHVMAGYLIGTMPFLQPYLIYIAGGIILTVTIPIIIGIIRSLRK